MTTNHILNYIFFAEPLVLHNIGREANGGQRFYLAVILPLYVFAQLGVAVLQAVPNGFSRVGPQAVNELVLPLVRALSYGFIVLVDEYGLDACGTEFDSENGLTGLDGLLCSHNIKRLGNFLQR